MLTVYATTPMPLLARPLRIFTRAVYISLAQPNALSCPITTNFLPHPSPAAAVLYDPFCAGTHTHTKTTETLILTALSRRKKVSTTVTVASASRSRFSFFFRLFTLIFSPRFLNYGYACLVAKPNYR